MVREKDNHFPSNGLYDSVYYRHLLLNMGGKFCKEKRKLKRTGPFLPSAAVVGFYLLFCLSLTVPWLENGLRSYSIIRPICLERIGKYCCLVTLQLVFIWLFHGMEGSNWVGWINRNTAIIAGLR